MVASVWASHVLFKIFTTTQHSKYYSYIHFTDGETKVWRCYITHPRVHSSWKRRQRDFTSAWGLDHKVCFEISILDPPAFSSAPKEPHCSPVSTHPRLHEHLQTCFLSLKCLFCDFFFKETVQWKIKASTCLCVLCASHCSKHNRCINAFNNLITTSVLEEEARRFQLVGRKAGF